MSQHQTQMQPTLLFCATPYRGHVTPLLSMAIDLSKHGFKIEFLTGVGYQNEIEAQGFTFHSLPYKCDLSVGSLDEKYPERVGMTEKERDAFDLDYTIIRVLPSQYEAVKDALAVMKAQNPDEDVVIIYDYIFFGTLPAILHLKMPEEFPELKGLRGCIAIGITPISITSVDTAPFGTCLPPDSSPEGRAKNKQLYEENLKVSHVTQTTLFEMMSSQVANYTLEQPWLDELVRIPDYFLQLSTPDFEYYRSDLPAKIQFIGTVPSRPLTDADTATREFLEQLRASCFDQTGKQIKRLVAVSQSTIHKSPEHHTKIVIPTMEGLAGDSTIHLIALLALKSATLPESVQIPANVTVFDFIPFDLLFPYLDAFVYEGGYGGVLAAAKYGVPLVLAPDCMDRPENGMRIARYGNGIDLKTGRPEPEVVAEAVRTVLDNPRYKERAQDLKASTARFNCTEIIKKCVEDVMRTV